MKNWSSQIDQITQYFTEAFSNLNAEQLNWKANPETWSIAQNIDHLIIINKSYFPIIDAIRNGTYSVSFLARFGFLVSFFEKSVLQAVQPDRKKKMKTFPIWQPTESEVSIDIMERFIDHQEQLKVLIEKSQDLVKSGTIISSPANKNIVYKLETAFDIIVAHEHRHFEQAREVYALLQNGNESLKH